MGAADAALYVMFTVGMSGYGFFTTMEPFAEMMFVVMFFIGGLYFTVAWLGVFNDGNENSN